jgi:uncharacterized protein YbaP (TraB family)
MLKTLLRRGFAAFGMSLALAAAPAEAKAPPAAKPALWAVSDADTTVYLFGTIHLLPEHYRWRTAKFDQAVEGSQQLVVETIIDDKNPQKFMSAMAGMALSRGLPPIDQRVPPDKRAALDQAIKKSGVAKPFFDQMKTWAAAFTLLSAQFQAMGLKGDEGVELVLRNAFIGAGKPVGELESNIEQLGFFDTLPEQAQRDFLQGTIEQPEAMSKDFDKMLAAWARGDVAAIGDTFNKELAGSPDLENALIKRRNANWSRWIEQRMASPGRIFIAVGAGHLAGNDSVIAMLRKDGYKVHRLQ